MENLFDASCARRDAEIFRDILARPGVRIERIVSLGQASPPEQWYEQAQAEWVAVLAGEARLRLQDPEEAISLRPGGHVLIAPHRRHRVEWTHPDRPTVWLAVHCDAGPHA